MNSDASSSAGPLSPAHYQELAAAEERGKKIRKAARVAQFNGWSLAIFAGFSALFAFFSLTGMIVTLGLAVVSYNEFRGRKGLLKFEPEAATLLGWNQVGFLTLIIGYCVWQLYAGLTTPLADQLSSSSEMQSLMPQLEGAGMGSLEGLYHTLIITIYTSVIVLTLLYQGWNAWYYFRQKQCVRDYLAETPAWVLDLKRQTG